MKTTSTAFRIFHDYTSLPLHKKRLYSMSLKIMQGERLGKKRILNIIFCSDYKIRKFNRLYRDRDRVTDVLAFPFKDGDLRGEVYVSLQRAAVQARRYGLSYHQEVERLFVHGVLHLAGFDHRTKAQSKRMQYRERRYCLLGGQVEML